METIRIKCPNCGAILTVVNSSDNQGKNVKCPVCKQTHPFSRFKIAKPKVSEEEDKTCLGFNTNTEDRTVLPDLQTAHSIGQLWDAVNNNRYLLAEGKNLIGRMTYQKAPDATIPIRTNDMGLSRKHLYIDVISGSDGMTRYYAYNAENKNPTIINGNILGNGDKVILHDGDIIQSSETKLILKLS